MPEETWGRRPRASPSKRFGMRLVAERGWRRGHGAADVLFALRADGSSGRMDIAVLKAVVEELRRLLIGGRIAAVSAPGSFEIALEVRTPAGGRHFLLLSADPTVPRIHLVPQLPADAASPAPFGQFAKKHLVQGIIEDLTQEPWERVVVLRIARGPAPTLPHRYLLVAELMGKRSNIVLTEAGQGTVLDAARTVPPTRGTKRPVVQRGRYVTPARPPGGSLHEPPPEGWESLAEAIAGEEDGWRHLVDRFAGLSPLLAREILALAEAADVARGSAGGGKGLREAADAVVRRVEGSQFEPGIYCDRQTGKPCCLVAFPLTLYNHNPMVRHASINEAAQVFYAQATAALELQRRHSRLRQTVGTYVMRLERALAKVAEALAEAREGGQFRRVGDLLLANFSQLYRGMDSVTVRDEYDAARAEIIIHLDPALAPAENAAKYFRRAAKAERGRQVLGERRRRLEAELAYFRGVAPRLGGSPDEAQLDALEEELRARGYITGAPPSRAHRSAARRLFRHPYRTFASSDGWKILVGRSSAGNDYVTTVLASRDDLFLHVHAVPGSHVVVRNPRRLKSLPPAVVEQAAVLAAHYSRARRASRVAVSYTFRKYVSKPKGAKAGLVRLSRFSTIYVDPAAFAGLGLRELDEDKGREGAS